MDSFNEELLDLAYRTVQGRRGDEVTIAEVRKQMESSWIIYRNNTIAQQATRIYQRFPRAKLAGLAEAIAERVQELDGLCWELPDQDDEKALAEFSAHGLAVLRWLRSEMRGRAPMVKVTDEEIGTWIAERQTKQLPLWDRDGDGQLALWEGDPLEHPEPANADRRADGS